ncbi:MAG: AzlC family ABC transporter permease [Acidaminococcaceae bacterium]
MFFLKINKRVLQKISPIALGYLILGLACGILGQKASISPLEMFAMSILAYAGSSQFIGIAMMLQGASFFSIGLTILIVNLRYVLFSSTLTPYFSKCKLNFLALYTHGITDETFAVNLNSFETETDPYWTHEEALSLNFLGCIVWSLSNALGCYASASISLNINLVAYILTAMFLGIWVNYLANRTMIIVGLSSGILAIILEQLVPFKLHIVLSSVFCSGLACYLSLKNEGGANP